MADEGLTVEMLPARHGDGLWIEWGSPGDRHRMLIDGGPRASYDHVRRRLERLEVDDRVIDLLVVTHVDLDHIETPIELLRTPPRDLRINEVWFNDYRHLPKPDGGSGASEVDRGGIQGEFLAALIERRALAWNEKFEGRAVVIPKGAPLPRVELPGGLVLVLLSPTPAKLAALVPEWEKAVA